MGLWAVDYLDIETKIRRVMSSRGNSGMKNAVGLAYARREALIMCPLGYWGLRRRAVVGLLSRCGSFPIV